MNTYILVFSGNALSRDELDQQLTMDLLNTEHIFSLRYVLEKWESIILVFDSDFTKKELGKTLKSLMGKLPIKFYLLFNKKNTMFYELPPGMVDIINKEIPKESVLYVEVFIKEEELKIDDILDKIEKFGIESLTKKEKNFLDNFKK